MKLAFWLFLLLLVTNGLSAFLGNELGRKIGKRKLSIFALRPKHSSTFLTILLGMTLSLGAMGLWLGLDSDARSHLLFPENAAEQQLANYQDHLATANRTLQRLRSQQAKLMPAPAAEAPAAPIQLAQLRPTPAEQGRLAPSAPTAQVALATTQPPIAATTRVKTTVSAPPMRTARLAPPAKITLKSSPAAPSAPAPVSETLPVRLVAQQNDLLFSFEVPGAQSESASRAIVSEVLKMTEQYARELGVEPQDSSIHILPQELEQAIRQLQQPSAFALQVKVAQDTHTRQPLPIHLTLQTSASDSFDPHDLLEKERLGGNETRAVLQQGMQEAIAQTIRQKQDQGLRVAEYKPTPHSEGKLFSAPVETWRNAEVPVRFSNVIHRNATIYGTITTQASALDPDAEDSKIE